jgi:hypothetical protein
MSSSPKPRSLASRVAASAPPSGIIWTAAAIPIEEAGKLYVRVFPEKEGTNDKKLRWWNLVVLVRSTTFFLSQ